MTRLLIAGCIVALLVVAGCDRKGTSTPPATTSAPATQAAAKVRCVMCVDHEFVAKPTTPTAEYKGRTYYFCSDYCKTEFGKDPAKAVAVFEQRQAARDASH
jgi:YHS domain-containing protein